MGKGHECETCEFKGRCDGFVCQNKLAEDSGEELKINVIENSPENHGRVCIKCATCENHIVEKALSKKTSGRPAVKNNVSPVVVHKEVREMSWDAFRATGLLTFINGFLHIFGWAICVEYKDGIFIRAYPMRTTWRGFKEETWTMAYGKIADYMAENACKIKEETKNG